MDNQRGWLFCMLCQRKPLYAKPFSNGMGASKRTQANQRYRESVSSRRSSKCHSRCWCYFASFVRYWVTIWFRSGVFPQTREWYFCSGLSSSHACCLQIATRLGKGPRGHFSCVVHRGIHLFRLVYALRRYYFCRALFTVEAMAKKHIRRVAE